MPAFVPSVSAPFIGSSHYIGGANSHLKKSQEPSKCPYHGHHVPSTRRATAAKTITITMELQGSRKFLVGGNWKCNLDKASITSLVDSFNSGAQLDSESVEVVCAPPSVYIDFVKTRLRNDFKIGAQNAWIGEGGAFTGELNAKMLKDIGCEYVILGHSERRHIDVIKETDETVAKKVAYALGTGLRVILCIGEKLDERESGRTMEVCERQLKAVADVIDDWKNVVIAYEPVWAIGTGKVATPQQAGEAHENIRKWLSRNVSRDVADTTQILYGGSVNPGNCQELAKLEDVDGFLVGGASLKPGFLDIVASYKAAMPSPV